MIINTIKVSECAPQTIVIGRRGTYDTMQIAFDLSYLVESYGNGVAVLAVKRSQDESAYPAVTSQEDDLLLWTVSETDTFYVGAGEAQLMWYVDGGLAKTIIYPMVVMKDILVTSEEAPDAYQEWVDALIAEGAETLQNAQAAAQSASDAESAKDDAVTAEEAAEAAQQAAETAVTHYPKIENNYWMVWDSTSQSYVSTGIQAEGEDGYSPEITIESITGGHRVTITDKDHPQGQSFDVMDGQGGGGTSDYTDLTNKPSINNVTLTENKTAADLGLATPSDIPTNAGDIEFDDQETYGNGTVGKELSDVKNAISQKAPLIINTASGDVANFADGADGMQIRKIVGTIVTPEGGSGWTGANITRTGKNLLDIDSVDTFVTNPSGATYTSYITNKVFYSGGVTGIAGGSVIPLRGIPGEKYTISFHVENSTNAISIVKFDVNPDNTWKNYANLTAIFNPPDGTGDVSLTFVFPSDAEYISFEIDGASRNSATASNIMYVLGSSAGEYEEYHATTLPINWQTEAGTILNGTVTLNEDRSADVVNSDTEGTYHLTDVGSLSTFYGYNNIWIDTGAITECDYPADTKLYIDGLTEPDEDMIANANIASGKYFVVNNQLYLSTAAIAAGASIVPGTNCTATNLAEALNALNT